ncbi:MAG: hypothetical protein ACJ8AT_26900 [Hyalangium sp.]|uniref:hypothetical protein n=1 Tax=Hyalangium sp. TaxID=2028555 RepID=UPI003899FCB0
MPSLAVSLLLVSSLCALEARAETPSEILHVAAPGLTGVGMTEATAAFYSEHLAQQLSFAGARVVTQKELQALIGLNRQQQLMGCAEGNTGCVLELSKALGVDAMLIGDVALVDGKRFQVTLKLISAKDASVLAAHSARVDGEEALLDELTNAARRMAPEAATKLGRRLEPSLHEAAAGGQGTVRRWAWVPVAAGAVAVGFGAFAYNRAAQRHDDLTQTQGLGRGTAKDLRDSGKSWQTASRVGLGLGVAGLLTGATMYLLGGPSAPVTPVAMVGREHLTVGFTGVLP